MTIQTAYDLTKLDKNSIVRVAGIVTLRQRPGTANGVIFLSLEDETGTINIICWKNIFNKFHRQILLSKLLLIEGLMQKEHGVINIVAHSIKDISELLKLLPKINKF
tara:strand:- start:163 stop:483 length:321 start_codon:yes stop_codon:yes gene_type:complete